PPTTTTEISTLSLLDALPILKSVKIEDYQANGHAPKLRDREWEAKIMIDATMHYPMPPVALPPKEIMEEARELWTKAGLPPVSPDRKSTRLNSSHVKISYAVF